MKIGIYLGAFKPTEGGGYTFQESMLKRLSQYEKLPFEFVVFFYGQSFLEISGLKIVQIRESLFQRIARRMNRLIGKEYPSGLQHTIEREKIDFVWFTSFSYEQVEVPFMYTVWDLQHRLQPWFPEVSKNGQWNSREKMYRQALGRASFVLTGTTASERELMQFYGTPASRIRKLLHPVPELNVNEVGNSTSLTPAEWKGKYWFYPAQYWAHKNHIRILLALQWLNANEPSQKTLAVFCGSDKGNQEYLKRQARELGVADQVRFLGFVSHTQLLELYKNCFALVFPSFFGPENLPPLEAFALGCPVIASDVDGAREQLGDACLLFDPSSAESLATQYTILRDSTELRNKLIERGRLRASSYTVSHYLNDVFKILNEFQGRRITWAS